LSERAPAPYSRQRRRQVATDDRTRVALKADAGAHDIPILPALRRRLIAHRLASPWTRPAHPVVAATSGAPKGCQNVRRALAIVGDELGIDLKSHDFRPRFVGLFQVGGAGLEPATSCL
jgi:hypothetical protein